MFDFNEYLFYKVVESHLGSVSTGERLTSPTELLDHLMGDCSEVIAVHLESGYKWVLSCDEETRAVFPDTLLTPPPEYMQEFDTWEEADTGS